MAKLSLCWEIRMEGLFNLGEPQARRLEESHEELNPKGVVTSGRESVEDRRDEGTPNWRIEKAAPALSGRQGLRSGDLGSLSWGMIVWLFQHP